MQAVLITLLSCYTRFYYVPVDGRGFRHGGVFWQRCGDSTGWVGLGLPTPQSPGRREWKVLCVGRERLDLTLLVIEGNTII